MKRIEAPYSHKFHTALSADALWEYLLHGFQDSRSLIEWPHPYVDLREQTAPLQLNTSIQATYKMGPVKTKAPYRIHLFQPGTRRLGYRTEVAHPLDGRSEISVNPHRNGSTLEWKGVYAADDAKGLIALGWFKGLFERLFFSKLAEDLEAYAKAEPERPSVSASAIAQGLRWTPPTIARPGKTQQR